jgi:N-acyl-D-aspartate/D-glutamate deacylase
VKLTRSIFVFLLLTLSAQAGEVYDLVILGGRVMDPESGLDSVRNIGIIGSEIRVLTNAALSGREMIDARGLVVAPGFINLHWHGVELHSDRYQVMDGVTSSLELEVGVGDVDAWYASRKGKSLVHYGASVGHIPVRMRVMADPGDFLPAGVAARNPASEEELRSILDGIERGLRQGAAGVGFGLAYTPAASSWETLQAFRLAHAFNATTFVHIRGASSAGSADREQGLLEAISLSAVSGAPVHVAHIQSSGQASTGRMLQIIDEARSRGMDVTTECYPYTAGATRIESFLFDSWNDKTAEDYHKLQWSATGERLTRESFLRYRKQGGLVLIHANTEDIVHAAVAHPLTMIASDGFDVKPHQGHPRSAGTFTRILGRYVREERALSLMDALRKMTLLPAHRLEERVPSMRHKGRVQPGADADLVMFDADKVSDRATFEDADRYAEGVRYVLVGGTPVVSNGAVVEGVTPGQPIRAVQVH